MASYKLFFLSFSTFGFSLFWFLGDYRREIFALIKLDGDPLHYEASGKELFNSFLSFVRFFGLTVLALSYLRQQWPEYERFLWVLTGFSALIAYILVSYTWFKNWVAPLRWRNKPLVFTEDYPGYLRTYLDWTLLTLLSFGLLAPVRHLKLQKLKIEALSYDSHPFVFTGSIKTFYWLYLRGLCLSLLSFGFYWPYHQTQLWNFLCHHTRVGPYRFRSLLSGSESFWQALETLLVGIGSFGLAWPWIQDHRLGLKLSRLALLEWPLTSPTQTLASPQAQPVSPGP
jgi:uncharacterized membrane protein YjgN (DUF898 family)